MRLGQYSNGTDYKNMIDTNECIYLDLLQIGDKLAAHILHVIHANHDLNETTTIKKYIFDFIIIIMLANYHDEAMRVQKK